MVCNVIQGIVDPDMCRRVDQRASAALDLGVFPLTVLEQLDLFHVGLPVNLSV